jgi:hypothetical protein
LSGGLCGRGPRGERYQDANQSTKFMHHR